MWFLRKYKLLIAFIFLTFLAYLQLMKHKLPLLLHSKASEIICILTRNAVLYIRLVCWGYQSLLIKRQDELMNINMNPN